MGPTTWMALVLVSALCVVEIEAVNLLTNGDFESSLSGGAWTCRGCTLELSSDSYSGSHAGHVSNRRGRTSGPSQAVSVVAGKSYFYRGYIKLLNTSPNHMYHNVIVKVKLGKDSNGLRQQDYVGITNYIQPGIWSEIGGDFTIPSYVQGNVQVYVRIDQKNVNYILDDVTVEEIKELTNFKSEADQRIDQLRKQDITVDMSGPDEIENEMRIELKQTRNAFPMGAMVQPGQFMDPAYKKYQDFFFDNFNYGTIGNGIKWKQMEKIQGSVDFDTPGNALDAMRARGLKVRGHNVFWGGAHHTPDWVVPLPLDQLKTAMENRINQSVGYFEGKLDVWDVNNENIHVDWYEQRFQDPNITQWMFRECHKADPDAKLYLNDFRVVNDGGSTAALVNQAKLLKDAGVPIHGLSPQSHMKHGVDVSLMKHRLDELSRAGLPIWVSELDVPYASHTERAQKLDEALRLFFSHPSVIGVVLWGFWDGMKDSNAEKALVNGADLTLNAAGTRFQQLWREEWRTHVTQALPNGRTTIRGFKGDYSVKVLHGDQVLKEETFTLGDAPLALTISASLSGGEVTVQEIVVS